MVQKLVNLVALLSIAVIGSSFVAQPANALSTHGNSHLNRANHHALGAQKNRRSNASATKKCRKRPTLSSVAHPTSTAATEPVKAVSSSSLSSSSSHTETAKANTFVAGKPTSTPQAPATPSPSPSPSPKPETTTQKMTTSKTSTSAAVTPTHISSGGAFNPKGGLAWANGDTPHLNNFLGSEISWLYSWSPKCPPSSSGHLKCIPMLWGADQEAEFVANAAKQATSGWVASFNEPNQPGQSNLSPQDAAAIHMRAIQPLADQGFKVVGPATSSDPRGLQWVKDFLEACHNCKIDAIGIHYYDVTADGFIKYMNLWHDTFGLPLIVTEFDCQNFNGGPQCTNPQVWQFMKESIQFMQSTPWVLGYAPFGVMTQMQGVNSLNQLMKDDGTPTDLGYTFIGGKW